MNRLSSLRQESSKEYERMVGNLILFVVLFSLSLWAFYILIYDSRVAKDVVVVILAVFTSKASIAFLVFFFQRKRSTTKYLMSYFKKR